MRAKNPAWTKVNEPIGHEPQCSGYLQELCKVVERNVEAVTTVVDVVPVAEVLPLGEGGRHGVRNVGIDTVRGEANFVAVGSALSHRFVAHVIH